MTNKNFAFGSSPANETSYNLEDEIIAKSSSGYQNLPMLDVIFARLPMDLSTALKTRAGIIAEILPSKVSYTSWGAILEDSQEFAIYAVADARPWNGTAILRMDPLFFFSAMETQLTGTVTPGDAPARHPSTIERRLAKNLSAIVFDELGSNFARLTDVKFEIDTIENSQQIMTQLGSAAACARCEVEVKIGDNVGKVAIIIPITTLEPIRPKLTKMFLGDKLGGDGTWRDHIENKLTGSSVEVQAHIASVNTNLAEVLNWAPGTTIDLGIVEDDVEVTLVCSGMPIFYGRTGQTKAKKLAVRVTRENCGPVTVETA